MNRSDQVQNVLIVRKMNKNKTHGELGILLLCVCMRWGKYTVSLSPSESKWANDVNLAYVT